MRVAFTSIGGSGWTGGRNYLCNLLSVLMRYESGRIKPVLFIGSDATADEFEAFEQIPNLEIVRSAVFNAERRRTSLLKSLLWGRDRTVASLFDRHDIDVVFESAQFFGWRLGRPAVAWIPDFQHRMLPELFSPFARLKRELGFRAQIAGRRWVMLSSDDARHACEFFYPATRGRTETVNFAMLPTPPVELDRALQIAAETYGLREPFFFLPNQFWRHKNHGLVVDALALLRQRGLRLVIAASGQQADPRFPGHVHALRAHIDQLGLENEFRMLGLIPYDHINALLRACMAMINPSLFEGWSTTVEEARLLGTPMLLSDLDVHKEQMKDQAFYFDRRSPAALAECLERFMPLDDNARACAFARAQMEAHNRARNYAASFVQLAQRCVRSKSSL